MVKSCDFAFFVHIKTPYRHSGYDNPEVQQFSSENMRNVVFTKTNGPSGPGLCNTKDC